ncbi:class I SAM-dependent methyltransferase [Xanthobacter sp. V4C-4]|uniref:class I SAM-dependent methyltransferase n=1 Tax=Xanthobacter cornucopiae TaxID=3119924 RepID=UPI00372A4BC4
MTPAGRPRPELRLWHWLGRQLADPRGRGGTVLGRLMAMVNGAPYRLAIEGLHPSRRHHVLEIGFGPGAGLAALARLLPDGRVCGIDGSPAMLRLAGRRNRAAIARGQMRLAQGDARRLPWANRSFDGVLAVNVAYFFDAEGRAIREIARVLRPGGRLALYVTDRATMRHWPFAGPDTHATFDADELGQLLRRGGFPPETVTVREVLLPLGIRGLVAIAVRPAP